MSSWFFVKEGQRSGPMGRAELDARIADGAVNADTLVWRTGLDRWARAGDVAELGLAGAPPPPPLPVATATSGRPFEAERPAWMDESDRRQSETRRTEARVASPRATASAVEFAGFWVRLAAKLIDSVVLFGFAVLVERSVAALYFGGVVPNITTDWADWVRLATITVPINLVVVLAYSIYFIRRHEATPGKRLMGLRVVRADGGRVGAGRVIGRYFAEQVSGIVFLTGYVMAAFDEEKRALHDYMCDTRVVKGPREDEN